MGAIRRDIDAAVVEHIIEMLPYGQLTIVDFKPSDQFPPYDAVMEALADIMDRALRPEGGNGKAAIRRITAAARTKMKQIRAAFRAQEISPALRRMNRMVVYRY